MKKVLAVVAIAAMFAAVACCNTKPVEPEEETTVEGTEEVAPTCEEEAPVAEVVAE
jgi:hypothetical protein